MNEAQKASKTFWGAPLWRTIHNLAASYTPEKKKEFKVFINSLTTLLPCEKCQQNLKKNLKKLKVDDYLDNNHQLFLWSYFLHDMVNKELGKKSPPYVDVKAFFFKSLGSDCISCKLE